METARKIRLAHLMLAALTTFLAACGESPVAPTAQLKNWLRDPSSTELRLAVERMGFREDMIVDKGDYFLIEGDISISKAELSRQLKSVKHPNQHHMYAVVSSANITNVLVDLSRLRADWDTAAREAMAEWNAIPNTAINFVPSTATGATIVYHGFLGGPIAQTEFPANGNPAASVAVDTTVQATLFPAHKKWVMVHELGHVIALRHANWQSDATQTSGAVHIPGTPTLDSASVMFAVHPPRSWNGFTQYDEIAAVYLYPVDGPTLSISYPNSTSSALSWTQVAGASSYRVRMIRDEHWWSNYHGYNLYGQGIEERGTTTLLSFTDTGYWYTGATICYYANEEEEMTVQQYYIVQAVFANGVSKWSNDVGQVARSMGGPAEACY